MNILKKLLYIIPLLAMLSCTERWEDNLTDDGKLSTTISVVLPQLPDAHPQTRAMAVQPDMQNLYVAVFDKNGYLLEYVEADKTNNNTVMATENRTAYAYKVKLTTTNTKTYVHFIGNAPKTSLDFGSEEDVLSSLYTEGGNEAYWQRVELTDGIKNDQATVDALTGVKLIRNFAWINVISTAANFTIDSYCVVNTRTKGSIAPYNSNTRQFVNFTDNKNYTSITGSGTNQDGTSQDGYNGFIPASATIDKNIPEESNWFQASPQSSSENYAYFVYEREKALSEPPFILIKATYNGTSERYYKVDLRDSQGNYFPIVRNFKYRINITGVGHSGYDSAEDAANGAGSGDVSSALETQSFNNISNGEARLFVSYTDTTIVEQTNDVKLRYKYIVYITDSEGNVKEDNRTQTATVESEGTVIPTQTDANGTVLPEYAIKHITDKTNEWYGWSEITFSTTALPTAPNTKTQQFIITGTDNEYSLHRKVNITLRNKFDFIGLVCDPIEIPTAMGKPFDVIVKVPGGLGRSMFPLDIQLEAANQSMTPNLGDNLPTVTGPSIVPDKNKTTIGFIKQINWVEYEEYFTENLGAAFMPARCHFKSNKSNTAGSSTTIYASNKYFNQTNAPLGYFDAAQFTDLKISNKDGNETLPTSKDQDVTFTFNMSELPSRVTGNDGTVTVALCNLMPADDDLTQVGVDTEKGIAYYSFTPESKNAELKLKNTDVNVEAKVMLSSYHFENAERAMNYTKGTFNNLSLTPANKYLSKDSRVTFTFRLSRQVKTGRYITVTLGNLVPADTETPLTLINEKDGTYRLDPTDMAANTDITLYLNVKNAYQTVSAKLSADYFTDNSVSKAPQKGTFRELSLTSNDAKLTAGSTATFNFKVSEIPPSGYVTLNLENLESVSGGATRSTSLNYTLQKAAGQTEAVTFRVIDSYKTVKVSISADCFEDAETQILTPKFKVTRGLINVSSEDYMSRSNSMTFYIYSKHPGKESSPSNEITSFTAKKGSTNAGDINIELDETHYQAIKNNGGYIFIRLYRNQVYYVATIELKDFLDGATLSFEQQQ